MFRLRVFVVLAAVGLGVLLVVRPTGVDLSRDQAIDVPVTTPTATTSAEGLPTAESFPLNRPAMEVLAAPSRLVLREWGRIEVRAVPPARPGDRVYLRTGGTYGLGYNKVSSAVLDERLRAVLDVPGRSYLGTFTYWAAIPASARHQEGTSQKVQITIARPGFQVDPDCGGARPAKADGTHWECTFNDEFEGTGLDRRYWVPQVTETSGFTTGTRSRYACAYDGPETIAVEDGVLRLSLVDLGQRRRCGKNKSSQYVFGQVMHFQTHSQTYGKYEIRAKVPDVRVDGVQQSFWLWPVKNSYGPWPASGEIDFAEIYSSTPGVLRPYLHYLPGEKEGGTNKNVVTARCPIDVGAYNTYGVEWEPRRITVLLNGEVCFVNDYSSAAAAVHGRNSPFDKPFYLAMNQAMGALGNEYVPGTVPERVTTQVDYVRIWR